MQRLSTGLFVVCGIWMIGLGVYFIALRPALLPEDLRYFDRTLAEVRAFAPGLLRWLGHVFTVMGGFMAAVGVLTVFVASTAPRSTAATVALALAGLLSVILMSAVNFAIASDFRWLLLAPALLWATAAGLLALTLRPRARN